MPEGKKPYQVALERAAARGLSYREKYGRPFADPELARALADDLCRRSRLMALASGSFGEGELRTIWDQDRAMVLQTLSETAEFLTALLAVKNRDEEGAAADWMRLLTKTPTFAQGSVMPEVPPGEKLAVLKLEFERAVGRAIIQLGFWLEMMVENGMIGVFEDDATHSCIHLVAHREAVEEASERIVTVPNIFTRFKLENTALEVFGPGRQNHPVVQHLVESAPGWIRSYLKQLSGHCVEFQEMREIESEARGVTGVPSRDHIMEALIFGPFVLIQWEQPTPEERFRRMISRRGSRLEVWGFCLITAVVITTALPHFGWGDRALMGLGLCLILRGVYLKRLVRDPDFQISLMLWEIAAETKAKLREKLGRVARRIRKRVRQK